MDFKKHRMDIGNHWTSGQGWRKQILRPQPGQLKNTIITKRKVNGKSLLYYSDGKIQEEQFLMQENFWMSGAI